MLVVTALALALSAPVATAAACACPRPRPTLEELVATRPDLTIFVARVVSVLSPVKGEPTLTRFAVEDVIRGEPPDVVEMRGVTFQDDPCGIDLRVGELRTVAAYQRGDGAWFTSDCLSPRPD